MSRYWVSVPISEPLSIDVDEEEAIALNEARSALAALGALYEEFQMTLKTYSLQEAKEFREEATKIVSELYEKVDWGFNIDESFIEIVSQPECPNCDYYGRFRDSYCPRCGTELIKSKRF